MKKRVNIVVGCFIFVISMFVVVNINTHHIDVAQAGKNKNVTDRIPIFTFHRLVPDDVKKERYPHNQWVGSIDVFAQMMKYLYDNDYKTITTEEFYEWYIGRREYDKKTVLITFDDGFYEDYYLALPILKKYNFKATSFVVGSRLKNTTRPYDKNVTAFLGKDVIEEVRKTYPNFQFQSHSYDMHYYVSKKKHRISTMSKKDIENDFANNRQFNFTTMAYPYGDYNKTIQGVLEKEGYLLAFRFGPYDYATRKSERYAIPRIKLNGDATLNTMKKWLNY